MDKLEPLVDVSLILRGECLDPEQVTSMLGTAGSKMRKKGDKWRTSTNHEVTAKIGLWALDASRDSISVSDQLSWLRQKLSSATCSPSCVSGVQDAEIYVFIALGENDSDGDYSFYLTPDDLAWITSLGTKISFDVACVPDGGSKPTEEVGGQIPS